MSIKTNEWINNQTQYPNLDDDIYTILNGILINHKGQPPNRLYNDIRLVLREIIVNEHLHSTSALIIGLRIELSSHLFRATIYHDGAKFDPFESTNNCKLLLQLNTEYKFSHDFIGTDSGRHKMTFQFDLTSEYTGDTND
jgi:hypothetical protein